MRMTSGKTAGDVRSRILHATMMILVDSGTRALKSADVAAAAKTTESTLFRHFNSLEEVCQALYDDCWHRINERLFTASFRRPHVGDAESVLLADFDELWAMRGDEEFEDVVLLAFLFYRRPQELTWDSSDPYESPNQRLFEERIQGLCEEIVHDLGGTISPVVLEKVLTNFAATVWLTWRLMPQGEGDLSAGEARLGIMGLVQRLVTGQPAYAATGP